MAVTGPLRITELANALTTHIDVGAPLDIMRMLRAVDGEMFAAEGVGGAPGPTAAGVAAVMEAAAEHVRRVISLPDGDDAGGGGGGLVVFSGSGTSGRLGFLAARAYNAALAARGRRHRFAYLIAGGDAALLKAQENVEDDAGVAVADLAALLDASRPSAAVLVGISCGLTATYVGAQLDYARTRPYFSVIALGFTPLSTLRPSVIEGWDRTFLDVATDLAADTTGRCLILNPVVGPEAITGSTRMKGGSMTKMLLEAVCVTALAGAGVVPVDPRAVPAGVLAGGDGAPAAGLPPRLMCAYHGAVDAVYEQSAAIAALMERAGAVLRAPLGSVVYIGADTAGIVGIVDASECPPTYGARFTDMRGFVIGGWAAMRCRSGGVDGAPLDEAYFVNTVLGALTTDALVIFLSIGGVWSPRLRGVYEAVRSAAHVGVGSIVVATAALDDGAAAEGARPMVDGEVVIGLPALGFFDGVFELGELALKLAVNAVSAGAHIMKGTVYENRMINVTISNVKLVHRAVGIVARVAAVSTEEAHDAILKAVFEVDELTDAIRGAPLSRVVSAGIVREKVVPLALLLAATARREREDGGAPRMTLADAKAALSAQPVLRRLIADLAKPAAVGK